MKPDPANPCCTPKSPFRDGPIAEPVTSNLSKGGMAFETVEIPGGTGLLGTSRPFILADEEGPVRRQTIKPFRMMSTTVTNQMFAQFITQTGYVTEAERFGWSFVFYSQISDDVSETQGVLGTEWWRRVDGAFWNAVFGPRSKGDALQDHPVVHVSWNDAKAFAQWSGGRLPSEAEWEHAARGGQGDVKYPWGDKDPDDSAFQPCNIWQGQFPNTNLALDGYEATAPAKSFAANGYGLFNMCGNVWEWTANPYKFRTVSKRKQAAANKPPGSKIMKGGSFLCHRSYCYRYRIPARTGTTPDSTTNHQGFRLVFDV